MEKYEVKIFSTAKQELLESSDYLNTVMDTLEKLHQMGGKKVGIISHVEGLKERIKTQIQVRRIDSSRSEIEVVNTL